MAVEFGKWITNTSNYDCATALDLAKETCGGQNRYLINLFGIPDACLNLQTLSSTAAPGNFNATSATASDPKTQVKITWTPITSGITSYVIESGSAVADRVWGFSTLTTITTPSTSSFTHSGLLPETKYKYRMYAVTTSGRRTGYTPIDSASTYFTYNGSTVSHRPPTPTGLSVKSAWSNGAYIQWNAVTSPSYAAASFYNVKRATSSSGPFVTIARTFETEFKDVNLINGKTYYYVVSGENYYGQSGNSSVLSITPTANLLPPVLFNTWVEPNTINYLGFQFQYTGQNAAGFLLEYAEQLPDGKYGIFGINYGVFTRGTTFSRNDMYEPNKYMAGYRDALAGNVSYIVRVLAYGQNTSGITVSNGNIWNITTPHFKESAPTDNLAPYKPLNVSATSMAPEAITVSWSYETSVGKAPTRVRILFKPSGGVWSEMGWGQMVAYPTSSITFSDPTIRPNKSAEVCAQSYREYREEDTIPIYSNYSNLASVSTSSSIAAPTDLTVTVNSYNKADLLWSDNSSAETNYIVERKVGTGSWSTIATLGPNIIQYTNTGLTAGTQYTYRVRAYKSTSPAVYSAYSAEMTRVTFSATAQSTTSPYTANLAIDNSTAEASRWSAGSTTCPQWWKVDMGTTYSTVSCFDITWRTAFAWRYFIEISTNGTTWTEVVNKRTNSASSQYTLDCLATPVSCRHVRITVTQAPSGVKPGFYEFRIIK